MRRLLDVAIPMPSRRCARRAVVAAIALAITTAILGITPPPAAHAQAAAPAYVAPVEAPVVDPFRPPPSPFAAGNRGLTYGTAAGVPVRASGAGEVLFAGPVGGTLHVTIRHADGLRTSYSFLATVTVAAGARVAQGAVVGTTSEVPFHFGVRDPEGTYLDPAWLLAGLLHPQVHLVPLAAPDLAVADAEERATLGAVVRARVLPGLGALLATGRDVGGAMAGRLHATVGLQVRSALAVTTPAHLGSVADQLARWYVEQHDCTPPSSAPPRPSGRRVLVLVAGLGSTSEPAGIDRLDTGALGYAPGDVVRFSYAGGRVPSGSGVPGGAGARIAARPYTAADSQQDLHRSAARLAQLLDEVAVANPGVPIDVVAHSQGGVVARLALGRDRPPLAVQHLVTLGSPHQGANLATSASVAGRFPLRAELLARVRSASGLSLDPASPAVTQLAEGSPVVRALEAGPPPPNVRLTSIGARGDLVVPAGHTVVPAPGRHTVVARSGRDAHDQLPADPEARREVALALAGRPPTCRSLARALTDVVTAESVDAAEDALTLATSS